MTTLHIRQEAAGKKKQHGPADLEASGAAYAGGYETGLEPEPSGQTKDTSMSTELNLLFPDADHVAVRLGGLTMTALDLFTRLAKKG